MSEYHNINGVIYVDLKHHEDCVEELEAEIKLLKQQADLDEECITQLQLSYSALRDQIKQHRLGL